MLKVLALFVHRQRQWASLGSPVAAVEDAGVAVAVIAANVRAAYRVFFFPSKPRARNSTRVGARRRIAPSTIANSNSTALCGLELGHVWSLSKHDVASTARTLTTASALSPFRASAEFTSENCRS